MVVVRCIAVLGGLCSQGPHFPALVSLAPAGPGGAGVAADPQAHGALGVLSGRAPRPPRQPGGSGSGGAGPIEPEPHSAERGGKKCFPRRSSMCLLLPSPPPAKLRLSTAGRSRRGSSHLLLPPPSPTASWCGMALPSWAVATRLTLPVFASCLSPATRERAETTLLWKLAKTPTMHCTLAHKLASKAPKSNKPILNSSLRETQLGRQSVQLRFLSFSLLATILRAPRNRETPAPTQLRRAPKGIPVRERTSHPAPQPAG